MRSRRQTSGPLTPSGAITGAAGSLDAFYRATTFEVYHPSGRTIPLRIGRWHPELDIVLPASVNTWAFLTASNPRSVVLSDRENAERMAALRDDVAGEGYAFWPGSGVSDETDWKPEESILVLGMLCGEADRLSERYDQNAYVYGERGDAAELVWTMGAADRARTRIAILDVAGDALMDG